MASDRQSTEILCVDEGGLGIKRPLSGLGERGAVSRSNCFDVSLYPWGSNEHAEPICLHGICNKKFFAVYLFLFWTISVTGKFCSVGVGLRGKKQQCGLPFSTKCAVSPPSNDFFSHLGKPTVDLCLPLVAWLCDVDRLEALLPEAESCEEESTA